MAPYQHQVSTHHRSTRARKVKKIGKLATLFVLIAILAISLDWLITRIRSDETVVSSSSNATVQSASINIFQTEFFRFQSDNSWKEVTDQFQNPKNVYIYRSYDENLIEHELWITVNKTDTFELEKHYPTRVIPVQIEADGRLTQLGEVSERCFETLPKTGNPSQDPRIVKQNQISYFCYPNSTAYNVAVGVPNGTEHLKIPRSNGSKIDVTIIYKNVTAFPETRQLESILATFKVL